MSIMVVAGYIIGCNTLKHSFDMKIWIYTSTLSWEYLSISIDFIEVRAAFTNMG